MDWKGVTPIEKLVNYVQYAITSAKLDLLIKYKVWLDESKSSYRFL